MKHLLRAARDNKRAKKKPLILFRAVGLRQELDVFFEDLSILLGSGMDIVSAVKIIQGQARAGRMKKIFVYLVSELEGGSSFARVVGELDLAPGFMQALIATGEESGKLVDNLQAAVAQARRMRDFFSKVRSAMLYPAIVLSLTFVVAIATAWFLLPRLTPTFTSLDVELPLITRWVVNLGSFIQAYGSRVIPALIGSFIVLVYILFVLRPTRFIGHSILFGIPVVKQVVRDSEVARLGYVLGVLLEAGLPITRALQATQNITELPPYRRLYSFLLRRIETGDSFEQCFRSFRRMNHLMPLTAQHMIVAGERGGGLGKALLNIGEAYEGKTTTHLRDITTILEPMILILVGIGVALVALSILLPIYSIIGGLR
ncbi:MAG: type II secretion system F family protein [Patescibacteria group bacterium]